MNKEEIFGSASKDGNGHEEQWLSETGLKEHQEKKEILEKEEFLRQNMMKAVILSATKDGYLHVGDVVMLVNAGAEGRDLSVVSINANIDGLIMTPQPGIKSPCDVSAGREEKPCTRNAFIITSVDGTPERSTLLFGQSFALKTTSGFAQGLYLRSDQRPPHKKSRIQEVKLLDEVSYESWWRIVHFDPEERLECEGQPVPASEKVVLKHYKTNQALAVLGDHLLNTAFGEDYQLVAHTLLDADKVNSNHWTIRTYQPVKIEVEFLKQP